MISSEKTIEDPNRKWRQFSTQIVLVMGGKTFATLILVALVAAVQIGGLARMEQARKASIMARFIARTAFVPVSLEDIPTLELIVNGYMDDPDLVRIAVTGMNGKILMSRQVRKAPGLRREIEASCPILPPEAKPDSSTTARPLGIVTVSVSVARIYRIVGRAIFWILIMSVLLFLLAVWIDRVLISRMTRQLQALVGEARMTEELRRSNQELEQFAFVASHDLQEPLRKIVNYCQLFQKNYKGKLDADADEIIRIIVSGGTRMGDLIKDLLAYARVGTQGRPLEPVDSEVVLREVLLSLQEAIRESGAIVTSGTLPAVMADPIQLGQLLQNIIGNAIKFRGDKPPEVRVNAERQGAQWLFSVRDNGIGIDPKYRDRVFEMFKRLHAKEKYPGTGIGLAICKKIVERHGGRIWVESAPSQTSARAAVPDAVAGAMVEGTVFYFTLPGGASTNGKGAAREGISLARGLIKL